MSTDSKNLLATKTSAHSSKHQSLLDSMSPTSTTSAATATLSSAMATAKVQSVKKQSLLRNGFASLEEWLAKPGNLYIGRPVNYPLVKVGGSKWRNPFKCSPTTTIEEVLQRFEEHVRNGSLWNDLEELQGKTLGCWCKPNPCHGDILVKLLAEKMGQSQAGRAVQNDVKQVQPKAEKVDINSSEAFPSLSSWSKPLKNTGRWKNQDGPGANPITKPSTEENDLTTGDKFPVPGSSSENTSKRKWKREGTVPYDISRPRASAGSIDVDSLDAFPALRHVAPKKER